jgi:hypothetical protein
MLSALSGRVQIVRHCVRVNLKVRQMDVETDNPFKGIHNTVNAAPDPGTAGPTMIAELMYQARQSTVVARALMADQTTLLPVWILTT